MKTIIYVGVALFSAASVYGVADYYQSEKKGILKNLYKEDPIVETPVERTINAEEYSRGKIEESATLNNEKEIADNIMLVNVKTSKKLSLTKKKIKATPKFKREINFKNFSRARLVPKIDTLKAEETELYNQ